MGAFFLELILLFVPSFLVISHFCKQKKELPLVAFFMQQKLASACKRLSTSVRAKNDSASLEDFLVN